MKKPNVSETYLALADECKIRARDCERLALDPSLSDAARLELVEQAKFYWQLAGENAETGTRLDAQRGKKVGEGLKDAAAITNARHSLPRERRFARLRELLPSMKLEPAAYQCESEGLGKAGAIIKQWNRHKKKRDT